MLHKSFKPAKCKTTLKLAVSRMKLLNNKRDAQVKQLKKELAQLLEAGQNQTARIRVEHVIREQKTMAAYDLIEIYCELIVARFPIIESQKNCPIDLKEAISSVIFASPRCADIPELMDVRKHFAAKYGKDFVAAAVELRPDCAVSRLLVEKLSAKAPDGPTKLKILTAIAEEHNVKWDPKSFGEAEIKPPEDLLNGPTTFEQAGKLHVEPPNVHEMPNSIGEGPPNSHVPSQHYGKHDVHVNSYVPNARSSVHSQDLPSKISSVNEELPSGTFHPDLTSAGNGTHGMHVRHPHSGDGGGFSLDRQRWNMEFKDATAAAQAAAESAERASMAARAAAELSSQERISGQHSTDSPKVYAFGSRNDGLQSYAGSQFQGEHLVRHQANNSFKGNSGQQQHQADVRAEDDLAGLAERFRNLKDNKSSHTASSNSISASMDDMVDINSQKSSSELAKSDYLAKASVKRESSGSEAEFLRESKDNFGNFEEEKITKQSSNVSLHFHLQTSSDNFNLFSNFNNQESEKEAFENPFIHDEGKFQRSSEETNLYDDSAVVFDDDVSVHDESKFDMEDEGRKLSSHLFADTNTWSSRQNMDESLKSSSESLFSTEVPPTSLFPGGLMSDAVPAQPDDYQPATFDDSDGPSSEIEEELDEPKSYGSARAAVYSPKESVYTGNPEPTLDEKPSFQKSSLTEKGNIVRNGNGYPDDSNFLQVFSNRNQEIEVNAESDRKFGSGDFHSSQSSPRPAKSRSNLDDVNDDLQTSGIISVERNVQRQSLATMKDAEPIEVFSMESGTELKFGPLTGGFRNRGYKHPPYKRNLPENSSLSKQEEEDTSTRIESSSSSFKVDTSTGGHGEEKYDKIMHSTANDKSSSRTSLASFDPVDDLDEQLSQHTMNSIQETCTQKESTEANRKPTSINYFDLDDDESKEYLPKQISTGKTHPRTGFSRRTKASTSRSEKNSDLKATVLCDSSVSSDSVGEMKAASSKNSHVSVTQKMPESEARSSGSWISSEQNRSTEQAASKAVLQFKRSSHEESSSRSSQATDSLQNPPSQSKSSDYWGISEQSRFAEQAASKPLPESKMFLGDEGPKLSTREEPKPLPESKRFLGHEGLKPSTGEEPFNPPSMAVASRSVGSAKSSNQHSEAPSRENSLSKASHVHPKLPDYDSLAAHLLSLRQNRQ